jgi:hypothetical protein
VSNNKQSSVDKEFVPYEEALALKKLGYDEPCLAYYNKKELFSFAQVCNEPLKGHYIKMSTRLCTPTFSQAFRWFREKYQESHTIEEQEIIYGQIDEIYKDDDFDLLPNTNWLARAGNLIKKYDTYEEAELECLRKLIEIVKEKTK